MTVAAADIIARATGARLCHVVDVGANPIEAVPYKPALDHGLVRVTGFEPNPQALAQLNASKSDRETYLPDALGAGGEATLHLYRHSGFSSLYPIDAAVAQRLGFGRATREVGRETVQTSRLDDLDLPPVDMLKIDVQGAEDDIIRNGVATLENAVAVWSEIRFLRLYEGEPSFAELHQELERQGFILHDFAALKKVALAGPEGAKPLRRRAFRQIVDGDAIYIRDPYELTQDQLVTLAILASGVLQSYELALFCVTQLIEIGALPASVEADFLAAIPENMRAEPALT